LEATLNTLNNWPASSWTMPGDRFAVEKPLRSVSDTTVENPGLYSDEQLIETILNKGGQHHFRMLIARHQTKVHAIALSVLGPGKQADAEDVAQEVFVKIYRQLDSFRGDSKFSTWLYRITYNLSIDHRRKHARHGADDLDNYTEPSTNQHAEHHQLEQEQAKLVASAVELLDSRQQVMIRMFYWQGFKTREIADVLGSPEGTVKVYLLRARQRLAVLLEELKA
jgi:RNA polymerase sigma-70 factor (ECF subfamily)